MIDDECCKCGNRLFIVLKSEEKGCWLMCTQCEKIFFHKWKNVENKGCDCG